MLILPSGHENVPSMKVEVVEQFIRLKRSSRNTELLTIAGAPVLDIDGGQVFCDGGWNAPNKAEQCQAALSDIHTANNQEGTYLMPCTLCVTAAEEKEKKCNKHSGSYPRVARCGNPTRNQVFKHTMAQQRRDGAAYVVKGDSQLLPSDLRALQRHLLSTSDICGLESWVIILIVCKIFLRPDEVLTLRIDSVENSLIVRKDGHVHSITVTVMGKTDKKPVHLILYADDDYPDLCPVRALLVYVHCAGIQGGWLFPKPQELNGDVQLGENETATTKAKNKNKLYRPNDGVYHHPLEYTTFLRQFKKTAASVIPTEGLKLGLHCLRKTAYLLAVWGDGKQHEIAWSARHVTEQNSCTYRRDAEILKKDARLQGNPQNAVSGWKSCRCVELGQGVCMNLENASGRLTLPKVAHDFVRKNLKFDDDHPYEKCHIVVMDVAMKYKRTCLEDIEEFARQLGLDGEKTVQFGRYVNLLIFRNRLQREENSKAEKQLGEIVGQEKKGRKREATASPAQEPPKKKPPPQPTATTKMKWISRDEAVAMPFGPEKIEALLSLLDSAPPPNKQKQ